MLTDRSWFADKLIHHAWLLVDVQDEWTVLHYAVWCVARTSGLCSAADEPDAQDVPRARSIFRLLLESGADVNAVNATGVTPLHMASWYGLEDVAKDLIDAKASVNEVASDVYKTRWQTIRDSNVITLFSRDCDLYRPDSFCIGENISALYLAARGGHVGIVKLLLKAEADVSISKSYGQHSGITALHAASAKGNADVVQELLAAGCDPNTQASDGGTPLHCAAEFGHLGVVEVLLKSAKSIKKPLEINLGKRCVEADNITALHLATTTGSEKIVGALIAAGCDVDAQASDGFTPIHLAAQNGAIEAAKRLLASKCNIHKRAALDGCYGLTPLHLAVRSGNLGIVNLLINSESDLDATASVAEIGNVSMFHLAAVCGHEDITKALLNAGCDPDTRTSAGSTPLFLAVKEGNAGVVECLVAAGVDVTAPQSNSSAGLLHMAVVGGSDEIAKILVEAGCPIDETTKSEEEGDITPLYLSVDLNRIAITKTLLKLGADVNAELKVSNTVSLWHKSRSAALMCRAFHLSFFTRKSNIPSFRRLKSFNNQLNNDQCQESNWFRCPSATKEKHTRGAGVSRSLCVVFQDGFTVLHTAAEQGAADTVRLLLQHGGDGDKPATFGDLVRVTPVHLAVMNKHVDVTREFAQAGCDLNVAKEFKGKGGFTPLYIAVKNNDVDMIKLLAEFGADVYKSREDGWTCLHAAAEQGNTEVVRTLLDSGCSVSVTASFDENKKVLPLHQAAQEGHETVSSAVSHSMSLATMIFVCNHFYRCF